MFQCDHEIENRKAGIVLIEKASNRCWTLNVAYIADNKVYERKEREVEIYNRLVLKFKQLWSTKMLVVVLIIVGTLETAIKNLKHMKQKEVPKTALLGTAQIPHKLLGK